MQFHSHKWLLFFFVAGFTIMIDQVAKLWIIRNLEINETILPLAALHPYLQITRISNTGIAFGIGSGGSSLFLILSLLIMAVLLYIYARSKPSEIRQHIAMAMIWGGASGNVVDRIQYGHVVDFVHLVVPGLISNVSNFADHAIVIGVGILLVDSFLQERRERKADQQKQADTQEAK